nr:MAG TPA: hypothetical protein [Caudoviricetes sp.]
MLCGIKERLNKIVIVVCINPQIVLCFRKCNKRHVLSLLPEKRLRKPEPPEPYQLCFAFLCIGCHETSGFELCQKCIEIILQCSNGSSLAVCLIRCRCKGRREPFNRSSLFDDQFPADMGDPATLFGIVLCVIAHSCPSLSSVHIKNLDAFGKDKLAVNTLCAGKADLSVGSIKLVQTLHAATGSVCNPVGREVAECDGSCACGHSRHLRRGVERIAEKSVRLSGSKRRLPHIHAVAVLELPDVSDSGIVHEELCLASVRSLQRIHKADQFICINLVVRGSGYSGRSAACSCSNHETGRSVNHSLAGLDSAVDEGILLSLAEGASEFLGDVAFDIEEAIGKQFIGNLDQVSELECINALLKEGRIAFGICAVFCSPCCGAVAVCNRNLALVLCSDDLAADGTHDVVFIKSANKGMLEFRRNEISAVAVIAFLQHITNDRVAGMTNVVPEGLLVGCRGSAGFILRFILYTGLSGERSRSRSTHHLVNLLLTLQALDILGEVGDFLFHLVVGCGILCRNHAAILRVAIKKRLSGLPCLRSLFHEFHNLSHSKNPPLMCEKRKALLKIGYWYHVFICFRLLLRNQSGKQRISNSLAREKHLRVSRILWDRFFSIPEQNLVSKAELYGFFGVHPCLGIHEL